VTAGHMQRRDKTDICISNLKILRYYTRYIICPVGSEGNVCLEDDIFIFKISLKNMPIINVLRYDVLLTVMNCLLRRKRT